MSQDIKNIICIGAGYVGSITMTIFANYHREINFYVICELFFAFYEIMISQIIYR